jgi:DNA-binding transcriptional MerR regulator
VIDDRTLSLAELADASGIPVRTLRYYVAQGILPAPGRQGRLTRYPAATLRRLQLLKRLRVANLPLAEIRERLAAMSDEEVAAALAPRGAAEQLELRAGAMLPPVYRVGPPADLRRVAESAAPFAEGLAAPDRRTDLEALDILPSPLRIPAGPGRPRPAREPGSRSQWERIFLEPGVELHVQRPLSRLAARRVERLVTHARELLERDLEGTDR